MASETLFLALKLTKKLTSLRTKINQALLLLFLRKHKVVKKLNHKLTQKRTYSTYLWPKKKLMTNIIDIWYSMLRHCRRFTRMEYMVKSIASFIHQNI